MRDESGQNEKEEKKELTRDDKKRLQKIRKEMIKRGEDTYEIDQQLGIDA